MHITRITLTLFLVALLRISALHAQEIAPDTILLDIHKAIDMGLAFNKELLQKQGSIRIAQAKLRDIKNEKLPNLDFESSLHVLGNLYQYEEGFFARSTAYELPRFQYNFHLSAEIPIYEGGRIRNKEQVAFLESKKQVIRYEQDERKLRMKLIASFFELLHLQEQQILMREKIVEDQANIVQVKVFSANGMVTDNEVLRSQLQLSNHSMLSSELANAMDILQEQLKPVLGLEPAMHLLLDTQGLLAADLTSSRQGDAPALALASSEQLKMEELEVKQKEITKKIVHANSLPTLHAAGSYGYDYPNFKFFPAEAHLYRFGAVGVKLKYPIANLYKNKVKMKIAKEEIRMQELRVEDSKAQILVELFVAQRKYEESQHKIKIAAEAVFQAKENFRIVQTKYANQLSLITELMDADNAYLEVRSNMISLSINKQLRYYQLQYILGNI